MCFRLISLRLTLALLPFIVMVVHGWELQTEIKEIIMAKRRKRSLTLNNHASVGAGEKNIHVPVDPSLSGLCGIKEPIKKDLECASFPTYFSEQHEKYCACCTEAAQADGESSRHGLTGDCLATTIKLSFVVNIPWVILCQIADEGDSSSQNILGLLLFFLPLCAWISHALKFKATLCRQASCISLQRYLIITPSILRDRRWPCLTLFWDNGQMLGKSFSSPLKIKPGQGWLLFSVWHRNPCKWCCQEDVQSERNRVGYRRTEHLPTPLCLGGSHQCIC